MPQRQRTDAFIRRPGHLLAWGLGATASVLFAPALTYLLAPGPWRHWGIEFGVGLGFMAMALMCLQFATSGRFLALARPIGQHTMMRLHRLLGVIAGMLVLAHALGLIVANPGYLAFLDPRVNLPRAVALIGVTLALITIIGLSLARRHIGVSYEVWRLLHGGLAAMIVVVGAAHIFMVGHHAGPLWQRALWIGLAVLALALLAWSRVVRPWQQLRRPWRIVEVRPEHARTCTLVLMPEGHAGLAFETGQHVWRTVGESSFSLQQHPFTIASSDARPERLELTIKALGDFTASVPDIPPGSRAYLEGPYG
ncbi:MAG: ferric reductase-like transmembrane domain-containing protein, partial [Gammaproteobacteria bacterium]|nr:ferric reductase-like transmembrane domain-containing protein [Gammaproteobacteria bacterium]